jgi:excisionase family DNA binding protein
MTARTTTRARHDIAHRNRQDEAREPAGQEEYLTPAQFADALSVSIRTVRNWMKTGVIHATRVGPRLIRIPTTEIQRVAVPIVEPAIARGSLGRSRR